MSLEERKVPSAYKDWNSVQRSYGVDASNDERYRHFFTRDSQTAGEHTQTRFPETARRGIDNAMMLQATQYNPKTEARRGRYPHEHATKYVDGKETSSEMQHVMKMLSADWGGTDEELLYYGSEDATPLTIVGAMQYYQEQGKTYKDSKSEDYFDGKLETHNGEMITRRESIFRGLEHLSDRIDSPAKGFSSVGLLGYKRINPKGHNNQVWMDSPASYMRTNGELPNYEGPLYAIELQGYAYDAFMYAIDVFGEKEPEKAQIWKKRADEIQKATLEKMWMKDKQFFAMGLDHDPRTKKLRPIAVRSINTAELLKSRIFDNLPPDQQEYYVGNIWKGLISKGFVTPAGLRCRNLETGTPIEYEGYHNEKFTWIKASHNAARGGEKWELTESAELLDASHINYVNVAGGNLELSYVDENNRVDYDPKSERLLEVVAKIVPKIVPAESIPEATQTWTVSSIIEAKHDRTDRYLVKQYQRWLKTLPSHQLKHIQATLHEKQRPLWDKALSTLGKDTRPEWVQKIDKEAAQVIGPVEVFSSREQIEAAFPMDYAFRLDTKEGSKRREKVLRKIYTEKTGAHSF